MGLEITSRTIVNNEEFVGNIDYFFQRNRDRTCDQHLIISWVKRDKL